MTDFGHNYGMAFQIIDDVLDLIATDEQLGKPAGNDLMEGVYTLPVIRALAGSNGEKLRNLLSNQLDKESRDQAISIMRGDDALFSAVETAISYTNRARNALSGLAPTPAARTLEMTCDLLLEQTNLASK